MSETFKPANRVLAALLSEHGRMSEYDPVNNTIVTHAGPTEQDYADAIAEDHERDLHRHDDDGGPGCPKERKAALEEAKAFMAQATIPHPARYPVYEPAPSFREALLREDLVAAENAALRAELRGQGYSAKDIEEIAPHSGAVSAVVSKSNHDALLPTGYDERKSIPIATGVLDYFPKALAAVAVVSRIGNDQHNPGQPLHWARGKSMDQDNTAIRHFIERGGFDTDGARHTAKAAWRLLAMLELEIEADGLGLERKAA